MNIHSGCLVFAGVVVSSTEIYNNNKIVYICGTLAGENRIVSGHRVCIAVVCIYP